MSGGVALMSRNNNGFLSALKDLAILPLIHSIVIAIFLLGPASSWPNSMTRNPDKGLILIKSELFLLIIHPF
jgi:hypothetical protein